jgi:TctA family transporter
MALSKQVEDSLRDAESNLRNALAFSARNEKPFVNKQISEMICAIDHLISLDNLMDIMESKMKGVKNDEDGPTFKFM